MDKPALIFSGATCPWQEPLIKLVLCKLVNFQKTNAEWGKLIFIWNGLCRALFAISYKHFYIRHFW